MTAIARRWWGYLKWRLRGSPVDDGSPSLGEFVERLGGVTAAASSSRLISVVLLGQVSLGEVAASVAAQSHANWELLIADTVDLGTLRTDPRVVRLPAVNPHDLAARAVASARGDLLVALQKGTVLTRHALAWFASVSPDIDLVYGDHAVRRHGRIVDVRLKPAWSPRLLQSMNYVGRTFAVATRRLTETAVRGLSDESGIWNLLLQLSGGPLQVAHIPAVLSAEPWSVTPRHRELREPPLAAPRIKVVIPTRDRVDLLEKAMAGIRLATGVAADLVVVDNGSTEPQSLRLLAALADTGTAVVRVDEPFNFSRLINRGARSGPRADYLLMLNNDISMAHPEWLSRLSGWLRDPGVVGVGPRLHFPDGRIQHAGMVMGLGGIAGHYALGERRTPRFGPPDAPREVSCLTGACLLVRMADFEAVGGLDEDFAIDFQDVDLCLRLRRQLGGDLIYDPTHPLTHVQMASRDPGAAGSEDTIARMRAKWGAVLDEPDQFWNPHLSLMSPGKALAMLPSDPDVLRSRLTPRVRVSSGAA